MWHTPLLSSGGTPRIWESWSSISKMSHRRLAFLALKIKIFFFWLIFTICQFFFKMKKKDIHEVFRSTILKKQNKIKPKLLLGYSIILVFQLEDYTQPFGMAIIHFTDLHILYQHRFLQSWHSLRYNTNDIGFCKIDMA